MIDVHAHVGVPAAELVAVDAPGYREHRAQVSRRYQNQSTADYTRAISVEWERKLGDLRERVLFMDRAGIDVQVMSVNPGQYYDWADARTASHLVDLINQGIAEQVALEPTRLLGLGTVSLQHPELVEGQLRRAVEHWGMVGVQLSTQAVGRDLASPDFEPLWTAAEELQAVVFVHPLGCPQLTDRLAPAYLNNIVGQPLETTIALSLMIFSGVFDRHPTLRLCAAHGGGYLPHYLGRSEHAYRVRPDSHTMERPPSDYLRRIWFDSVVLSPDVLANLIAAVGADRVVIGTDYPFDMGDEDPRALLAGVPGLSDAETTALGTANAQALLGRHAGRLSPPTRHPQ